jgi:uncharacterized protein YigE (DUF2233 family)
MRIKSAGSWHNANSAEAYRVFKDFLSEHMYKIKNAHDERLIEFAINGGIIEYRDMAKLGVNIRRWTNKRLDETRIRHGDVMVNEMPIFIENILGE